jgi:hypothetical protein
MLSSRLAARSARAVLKKDTCSICQSRQFTQALHRSGTVKLSLNSSRHGTNVQRRNYAAMRLDGPRARADVDARARLGFYTMNKQQGALKMEPHTAQSIYHDFMAQKDRMDHASNVLRLAKSAF